MGAIFNYLHYLFKKRIINYIDAKNFGDLFEKQNSKWFVIPFKLPNSERDSSKNLINIDKNLLKKAYEEMEILDHSDDERGWYRDKYVNEFRNKKILDLGCGSGKDGLFFAKRGARVTFADVVSTNLDLVKKMSRIYNLKANFYHIKSYEDYSRLGQFDFIYPIKELYWTISDNFSYNKAELSLNGNSVNGMMPEEYYQLQQPLKDVNYYSLGFWRYLG